MSKVELKYDRDITKTKIMMANTYPNLLMVKGKDKTPAPIIVFMIVITVRKKSMRYDIKYLL